LAVPPGSRNAPRPDPKAKGKLYRPVKVDKRSAGARSRSYAAKYSKEKSSPGNRNVFPGYGPLKTLSYGISEQQEPIYNVEEHNEEKKIFLINASIRTLIADLDAKEEDTTEQKNENKT
jgi:hypothetical protein